MDSSHPSTHPGAQKISRVARWVMLTLLLAYAVFLACQVNAVAGGADSSGYLNHARALSRGLVHLPARTLAPLPPPAGTEFLYSPLGLLPKDGGTVLVPSYPPGLPLLIAGTAALVGWTHAADVVLLVHAIAGVVLVFALGRALGLSPRLAFLGAAVIAASPLYFHYAVQAMSDLPALVWATTAVLAAWRSREKASWALAAGAALGVGVLIRPNNILALAPVLVALGFSPRRGLLLGVGALPTAAFFLLFNHSVYGGWLVTGYGDTGGMFVRAFLGKTLAHYAQWLPALFTPVVFGLLALPFTARATPRAAVMLGVWALAYLAFYATYRHTHETWWYLRFVLPAAPALVLGGLLAARALPLRWHTGTVGHVAFAAALVFTTASSVYWTRRLAAIAIGRSDQVYVDAAAWARTHLPPNALLATMQTSGALFYYTDFTLLRRDQFHADNTPSLLAAIAASGRPLYAVLMNWEVADGVLGRELPGRWTRLGASGEISFWRRDGDAP